MADDRMKNDDLNKNVGGRGTEDEASREQKSPGRSPQEDQSTEKRGTNPPLGDEEIATGNKGDRGGQGNMGRQ